MKNKYVRNVTRKVGLSNKSVHEIVKNTQTSSQVS